MNQYYCIFFKQDLTGKSNSTWITGEEFKALASGDSDCKFIYLERLDTIFNIDNIDSIGKPAIFRMSQVEGAEFRFGIDGTIPDMIDTVYAKKGDKEYKWNNGKWQPAQGLFSHAKTWEDFIKKK